MRVERAEQQRTRIAGTQRSGGDRAEIGAKAGVTQ
jgi:hypothetical protein